MVYRSLSKTKKDTGHTGYSGIGGSRGRQGVRTPTGKAYVSIGFLGNSGTDPLREAIGPIRSLEGDPYGPLRNTLVRKKKR